MMAPHDSRTLVGRDAELGAPLLHARHPSASGDGAPDRPHRRPAGRRRRRRQDPAADRAARPSPSPRAGRSLAGHCLDFGDSALPYLPFSEIIGRIATELPDVVDDGRRPPPRAARLQPGRGCCARPPTRPSPPPADQRATSSRRVHALARGRRPRRPAPPGRRGHSTGPTSRPATCSASCSPGLRRPGRPGRVLPLRRPPPPAPAPPPGRRVGPDAAASSGSSSSRCPPPTSARLVDAAPSRAPRRGARSRGIVDPRRGQRVLRRGARRRRVRPAAAGMPDDLADVLLVRLDRLDDAARQVVRAASVAGRRVSHAAARAPSSTCRPTELDAGRARRRRGQRAGRQRATTTTVPARPARRGGVRRPAARRAHPRSTRRTPRPCATAAPAAPRPSWPATPGWPRTTPPPCTASLRAGDDARAVGGAEEAAYHYLQALELLADARAPRRRRRRLPPAGRSAPPTP